MRLTIKPSPRRLASKFTMTRALKLPKDLIGLRNDNGSRTISRRNIIHRSITTRKSSEILICVSRFS